MEGSQRQIEARPKLLRPAILGVRWGTTGKRTQRRKKEKREKLHEESH